MPETGDGFEKPLGKLQNEIEFDPIIARVDARLLYVVIKINT